MKSPLFHLWPIISRLDRFRLFISLQVFFYHIRCLFFMFLVRAVNFNSSLLLLSRHFFWRRRSDPNRWSPRDHTMAESVMICYYLSLSVTICHYQMSDDIRQVLVSTWNKGSTLNPALIDNSLKGVVASPFFFSLPLFHWLFCSFLSLALLLALSDGGNVGKGNQQIRN